MSDVYVVKVKSAPIVVVKVRVSGPQGIPGLGLPPGNFATQNYVPRYVGPGAYDYQLQPLSTTSYTHTQTVPSETWSINHNLGYRPSVELMDAGGNEIEGDIVHASDNQLSVSLKPATAGLARLT
jgi:hypothetical protein